MTHHGDRGCLPGGQHHAWSPNSPPNGFAGIGDEEALAEPRTAELPYPRLGLWSHEKIRESLPTHGIDSRGVVWAHLHHVVHVVQQRISLDLGNELHLVTPREIRGPVGDSVGAFLV